MSSEEYMSVVVRGPAGKVEGLVGGMEIEQRIRVNKVGTNRSLRRSQGRACQRKSRMTGRCISIAVTETW